MPALSRGEVSSGMRVWQEARSNKEASRNAAASVAVRAGSRANMCLEDAPLDSLYRVTWRGGRRDAEGLTAAARRNAFTAETQRTQRKAKDKDLTQRTQRKEEGTETPSHEKADPSLRSG